MRLRRLIIIELGELDPPEYHIGNLPLANQYWGGGWLKRYIVAKGN
jgi:hypothetical protein